MTFVFDIIFICMLYIYMTRTDYFLAKNKKKLNFNEALLVIV